MARKLVDSGRTEADECSKKFLKRREYLKVSVAAAAIVTVSSTGLTATASEDGTVDAFSSGFEEYVQ